MPETDISICAKAIVLLGGSPISSFNEDNDPARTCALVYPMVRDDICTKYPWRFFMTKKQLTRDATAPIGEWKYSYVLPGDMGSSGPQALFPSASDKAPSVPFEIFGRRIYCDYEDVWIDYTVRTDENTWPPYFVTLMVYAMCATIGFSITDQQNTVTDWTNKAFGTPSEDGWGGQMGVAMNLDSQGQSNTGVEANAFIDARWGGYGYIGGSR